MHDVAGLRCSGLQALDDARVPPLRNEADVLAVRLVRYRQIEIASQGAHFALGHGAQRKHQRGKLRARRGKQEVALVAIAVAGPIEFGSGRTCPQLDIMPGGEHLGVELLHRGQQLVELDLLVAGDTRNRRLAGNIAFGEGLHDRRLEALLVVQDVVGDAELVGHPARIVNVLAGATGSPAAPRPRHGRKAAK